MEPETEKQLLAGLKSLFLQHDLYDIEVIEILTIALGMQMKKLTTYDTNQQVIKYLASIPPRAGFMCGGNYYCDREGKIRWKKTTTN